MISHFREPLDIASSNFSEEAAIFGGRRKPAHRPGKRRPPVPPALDRHRHDLPGRDHRRRRCRCISARSPPKEPRTACPRWSTSPRPATRHATRKDITPPCVALVEALAKDGPRHEAVNVIAPIGSPADLRYLKAIFRDFGLEPILLPDYSDTLDGPAWTEYQRDPAGRHAAGLDPPHGPRPGHGRIRLGLARGPDRGQVPGRAVRRAPPCGCRCRWA